MASLPPTALGTVPVALRVPARAHASATDSCGAQTMHARAEREHVAMRRTSRPRGTSNASTLAT
jgi:hypothetical protein